MVRLMVPSRAALAVLAALAYLPASMASTVCYYPNGDIATTYQPCNNTGGGSNSACCELSSSACSTTGYCYGSAGVMYRGGCTDQSFSAISCPQMCKDVNKNAFSNINLCPGGGHNGFFTCSGSGQFTLDICLSSNFTFNAGTPYTPASTVVQGATTITATSNPTSSTSSTTAAVAASQDCTEPVRTVGLAVGLPLGALALFLALVIFLQHRRPTSSRTKPQPAEIASSYFPPQDSTMYGSQTTPSQHYQGTIYSDGGSQWEPKPVPPMPMPMQPPPAELQNVEPVHELRAQ